MLRLLDGRTGRYTEIRSARRGLLRVCAYVPAAAGEPGLAGLRVLLVADLLARTAELRDLQVLTAHVIGERDRLDALERAADALNIYPPAVRVGPCEAQASLGGPIDVHLVSQHAEIEGDGLVTRVGPVGEADQPDEPDPLAIRLALLSVPYHQQADLSEGALAGARQTLGHWRRRVAEWAQSPSRPTPALVADQAWAAFDELDTASVLTLLRGLELDADVPPGAKFETFVYADRILGLDLPRDIGRAG